MARFAAGLTFLTLVLTLGGSWVNAQTPSKIDATNASVEGRVVNTRGVPLDGANVDLWTPPASGNGMVTYRAVTDEQGNFRVRNVPPGIYRLNVASYGYFALGDGSVTLAPSEHKTNLNFQLAAMPTIKGRITDEEGRPYPADLYFVQKQYSAGRVTFSTRNAYPEIGSDGEYTIPSVQPGRYYLWVKAQPAAEAQDKEAAEADYVDTFYPGVIKLSNAIPVEVVRGRDLREINIRVAKARTYRIKGAVIDPRGAAEQGETAPSEAVLLPLDDAPNMLSYPVPIAGSTFEFKNVSPGRYLIQTYPNSAVKSDSGAAMYFGQEWVTITDHDVEGVVIRRQPGAVITGNFSSEGQPAGKPFPQQAISLTPVGPSTTAIHASIAADGSFRMPFVPTGDYRVSYPYTRLPYLKSVRFSGADFTGKLIHIEAGQSATLEILGSWHAAQIQGIVRDKDQKPVAGAWVSAWSEGLAPDGSTDQFLRTITNGDGEFIFSQLQPGSYSVLAWENVEFGIDGLREFRRQFMTRDTTIEVREDSSYSLNLSVISSSKSEVAASKLP